MFVFFCEALIFTAQFLQVREALVFLHELGSVQYFANEFLRDRVVINPQWLVDVMACLISVKESVIQVVIFKRLFGKLLRRKQQR